MKACFSLLIFFSILITPAFTQEKSSSSGNSTTDPTINTRSSPLDNLSDKDRAALENAVNAILKDFNEEHYDDALLQLDQADKLSPKNPELLNFRGNILMKQVKWDQARTLFTEALAIDPKYFPARFNMGEIPYLQKKYADARTVFLSILSENPKNELVIYKIFLTYLLENNLEQAQIYLNKFDGFGDTPAYYFAQAAWSYNKKQDKEGDSYVQSAMNIFPSSVNIVFAKPLIDLGWLKATQQPGS